MVPSPVELVVDTDTKQPDSSFKGKQHPVASCLALAVCGDGVGWGGAGGSEVWVCNVSLRHAMFAVLSQRISERFTVGRLMFVWLEIRVLTQVRRTCDPFF